jgi:hypothetical protein
LIFALYITGRVQEAVDYIEKLDGVEFSHNREKLFFFTKKSRRLGAGA